MLRDFNGSTPPHTKKLIASRALLSPRPYSSLPGRRGWLASFPSDRGGVLLGALGLLLVSTVISIHWQPGTIGHHDTGYYLDGARQLANGNGFVSAESNLDGEKIAIANWPPGFSLLMVPALWLGLSVHQSAAFVLGASYSALLLASYALMLLATRINCWPWAAASSLILGFTPSLLEMENRLLSDLPMSAALMGALACYLFLLRQRTRWKPNGLGLGLAGALGAAFAGVVLIRWAGLFALVGVVLSFLLTVSIDQVKQHWKNVATACGTLIVLVGGWMLRNQLLTGQSMGARHSELTDPALHVERALGGVLLWATDARDYLGKESGEWLLFSLLLMAVFALLIAAALQVRFLGSVEALTLALTAGCYFVGLIFSASVHSFNSLFHPRYWIFLWAVFLCLAFFLATASEGPLRWFLRGSLAVALLGYAYCGVGQYESRHAASLQLGRTRAAPVQEIAEEMKAKDCRIVGNDNRVLMVNNAYEALYRFPKSKREFQKLAQRGPICILWIHPEGGSRTKVAPRQRKIIQWAAKHQIVRLAQRHRTYEVWLPGPS